MDRRERVLEEMREAWRIAWMSRRGAGRARVRLRIRRGTRAGEGDLRTSWRERVKEYGKCIEESVKDTHKLMEVDEDS